MENDIYTEAEKGQNNLFSKHSGHVFAVRSTLYCRVLDKV